MNIGVLLDMAVASFPDRTAVADDEADLTFAELDRISRGGAAELIASGAQSVAFIGVNDIVFPTVMLSAARAGLPLAPLSYRLAEPELARQLNSLDRPLVVFGSKISIPDTSDAAKLVAASEWLSLCQGQTEIDLPEVASDTTAVFLFTSGTTSEPKRAVLRHSHLTSYVLQTVEFGTANEADSALTSVPTYHIAGVGTVLSNLYAGRRMRYLPTFTPQSWLEIVRSEQVSSAMVVPTMLTRIVEHLDGKPSQTPSLRNLAYGGARISRPVLEQALAAFDQTGFVNAYGLTETSSTIAVLGPDDHRVAVDSDDESIRARLGSVGRLVPGVEGEIRDSEGLVLEPGNYGALWVRGAQVSGEYSGRGSSVDADGWFPTGDKACFDHDGYLFIEGRLDDTIIRGGENIAPAEIEDVLARHQSVRDVAVIGMPDDEWGERTVAVIVLKTGETPDGEDIRSWAREHLRGSRTPDDVVFVDELPHTPTGKLLRRQLRTDLEISQLTNH